MKWKAHFARRVARDGKLRDLKEDSFVRTMQDADEDGIYPVADPVISLDGGLLPSLATRRRQLNTQAGKSIATGGYGGGFFGGPRSGRGGRELGGTILGLSAQTATPYRTTGGVNG